MGRFFMYGTIGLLAVFVLSSYVLLNHGGGSIAQVQTVSVHDLTTRPPSFVGQPVTTEGTLSFSDEHGEHQIVDDGNFAVIIRDGDVNVNLANLVGRRVKVSGIFGIDDEDGVYIDAHAAQAID